MASNNWVFLVSYQQRHKSSILRAALETEGMEVKLVDKIDNAFNFMGSVEVYVRQDDFIKAKRVTEKLQL